MSVYGYPTLSQVRAWLSVTPASVSDDELTVIMRAEQAAQLRACDVPDNSTLPEPLVAAFYRRCARHAAAKNVPLGLTASDEFGAARVPSFDAEIERLEGAWRLVVFG